MTITDPGTHPFVHPSVDYIWLSADPLSSTGIPFVPVGVLISLSEEYLRRARAGLAGCRKGVWLHRTPKGEEPTELPPGHRCTPLDDAEGRTKRRRLDNDDVGSTVVCCHGIVFGLVLQSCRCKNFSTIISVDMGSPVPR